jgi:hypothetical protein
MSDELCDNELEEELRRLVGLLEPVPPWLVQAAQETFGWRDMDHELAELISDSLLDADEALLVRGSQERRLVSFRASEVSIDVEVTHTAAGRNLLGQLTPPQSAVVEIRRRHGAVEVEADELGRFRSGRLPPGPASLRIRPTADPAAPRVATDWICL